MLTSNTNGTIVGTFARLLLIVALFASVSSAAAQSPQSGRQVGEKAHCHDAAGPSILTCFETVHEVELDLQKRGKLPPKRIEKLEEKGLHSAVAFEPNLASIGTTAAVPCYVRLWSAINYSGSSRTLCNNYNDLRSIGFNDVTSSYEVLAGAVRLWSAINYQGARFESASSVPDLRPFGFNDVASSVEYVGG